MYFKNFILFKIALIIFILFPIYTSFAMEDDWFTNTTQTILPSSDQETITFKNDEGEKPDFTPTVKGNKSIIVDITSPFSKDIELPSLQTPEQIEKINKFSSLLYKSNHPLKGAINNKFETKGWRKVSALVTYYQYNRIKTDPYTWDDSALFLRELDMEFFIQPICKKTRFLQIVGGITGLAVPFAWAPLVMMLSQDILDPIIPIGGPLAYGILSYVFFSTAPPYAAQLSKFGKQIGNILFDYNGLTPEINAIDKKAHIRPKKYPMLSRIASLSTAFFRTAPYSLLFWEAESNFPIYGAAFIWPMFLSNTLRIYNDNIKGWERSSNLQDDEESPMVKYKKQILIASLETFKEILNQADSDELVDLMYASMKEELSKIQKYKERKARLHTHLRILLTSGIGNIRKISTNYIVDCLSNKTENISYADIVNNTETLYMNGLKGKPVTDHKTANGIIDLIDLQLQDAIRKIRISKRLYEKKAFTKNLKNIFGNYFVLTKQSSFFDHIFTFYQTEISQDSKYKTINQQNNKKREQAIRKIILNSFVPVLKKHIQTFLKENMKINAPLKFPLNFANVIGSNLEAEIQQTIKGQQIKDQSLIETISTHLKLNVEQAKILDVNETELNLFAKDILDQTKEKFLNDCTKNIVNKIYIYIQKDLGRTILANGLAVLQEDTLASIFSMLLIKTEVPLNFSDTKKELEDAFKKFSSAVKNPKGQNFQRQANQSGPQSEARELLNPIAELKEAVRGVEDLPIEKMDALIRILEEGKPKSYQKKLLSNLAIFQQGDAKVGRFLISQWFMTKILMSYLGVGPELTIAISVGVATLDAVLRPLQEWYLQQDVFSSVMDISSAFKIDYWPVRWIKNVSTAVSSAFFSLPSIAILLESLPSSGNYIQDILIKALIISATSPSEVASSIAFLKEHWNGIIRDVSDMSMLFFATTNQKRAWLNDKFDQAMELVPKLDDLSALELHNMTQDTF